MKTALKPYSSFTVHDILPNSATNLLFVHIPSPRSLQMNLIYRQQIKKKDLLY